MMKDALRPRAAGPGRPFRPIAAPTRALQQRGGPDDRDTAVAPGSAPPGMRIYAIGDVHGCADRLGALYRQIADDARARPAADIVLVHLGDYVDRGADSAGVIDLLRAPPPVAGATVVNLFGNHEMMMLEACAPDAPRETVAYWLENGGSATLRSYGAPADAAQPWRYVPPDDLDLLRGCALCWGAGDYLFVHAGIRPGRPVDQQDPMDMVWIREPFLSFDGDLPVVVVHGHTPAPWPEVRSHRIGIDTGACFGGALTCLILEDQGMRSLAA